MQRIIFIIVFFLFVNVKLVFACDCDSGGEFLTVAPKSEFVALVKVTKYSNFMDNDEKGTPTSMEVEVIDIYKGKERRKTLRIWGDNGILCRPYLSKFSIGEYFVIAFYKATDGANGLVHKDERPTDYAISICGDYWLQANIDKQTAKGAVTKQQSEIKLSDLKLMLTSN